MLQMRKDNTPWIHDTNRSNQTSVQTSCWTKVSDTHSNVLKLIYLIQTKVVKFFCLDHNLKEAENSAIFKDEQIVFQHISYSEIVANANIQPIIDVRSVTKDKIPQQQ